jgi:hypothetical protein
MVMNSHYIGPNPEDEPDEYDYAAPCSDLLTAGEISQVMQALSTGHGSSWTAGDLAAALQWAEGARASEMCLDLVLRGEVLLRVDERGMVEPIVVPIVDPA